MAWDMRELFYAHGNDKFCNGMMGKSQTLLGAQCIMFFVIVRHGNTCYNGRGIIAGRILLVGHFVFEPSLQR